LFPRGFLLPVIYFRDLPQAIPKQLIPELQLDKTALTSNIQASAP